MGVINRRICIVSIENENNLSVSALLDVYVVLLQHESCWI